GAVLDRDPYAVLARVTDQGRPHALEVLEALRHRAPLVAADKRADSRDPQPLRRLDDAAQMVVGSLPGVAVGVEVVGVVGERRDLEGAAAGAVADRPRG